MIALAMVAIVLTAEVTEMVQTVKGAKKTTICLKMATALIVAVMKLVCWFFFDCAKC